MTTLKIGPNFGPDYASATDYEDVLRGSSNNPIGFDLGAVGTGLFCPIISKELNQGHLDLYIRHNHTEIIHNVKTFISRIGAISSYTYGGSDNPINDFTLIESLGAASGGSKNNGNGASGGLWVDMNVLSNDLTRFDYTSDPTRVKIYGKNGEGNSFGTAFLIHADAMVGDSGGTETKAIGALNGKIGLEGDVFLGEAAHLKIRFYVPSGYTGKSGYFQGEYNVIFTEAA